jgi:hypothetical protein
MLHLHQDQPVEELMVVMAVVVVVVAVAVVEAVEAVEEVEEVEAVEVTQDPMTAKEIGKPRNYFFNSQIINININP